MAYQYTIQPISISKKGWQELGRTLKEMTDDGWELFMTVPITTASFYWFGWSGGRTTSIVHYFRRPLP